MEKRLRGREKQTIIKGIAKTGYKKIYDEPWENESTDSEKKYHVEVWIHNEHLYFFFSDTAQKGSGSIQMFSCMRSDTETLSNIEHKINFDTYDKGLFFSELLDKNFDLNLIKDPVLLQNQLDTNEVILMIKKCKTLKNYVALLNLQEELLLKHFFGLQDLFDQIKEKSREKHAEYTKYVEALERKLLIPIPESFELSEIVKAIKKNEGLNKNQPCDDGTDLLECV